MKKDYAEIADTLIAALGGKENIRFFGSETGFGNAFLSILPF